MTRARQGTLKAKLSHTPIALLAVSNRQDKAESRKPSPRNNIMSGPNKTSETVEALKQMMEEQAAQHANQIARLLAIIVDLIAHPPPQREHSPPNSTKSQTCPQHTHALHDTPSISAFSNHPNHHPCHHSEISSSNASSSHQVASSSHRARNNVRATEPIYQVSTQKPPRRQPRQFTPLSVPRDIMFQMLVEARILEPLQQISPPAGLSPNHRSDLYCEYHQCTGHTTLSCQRLAHKIQDLIDNGTFSLPSKPNTIPKPMPRRQVDRPNSTESLVPTKPILDQSVQAMAEQPEPTAPPAANAPEAKDV